MNTSLIKANEAFFASSACAEENNGRTPAPPRVHTSTPGMSRMSEDRKEKGSQKKKNTFGFMHLSQEA